MSSFGACAQTTRELNERLQELEQRVSLLEIPALAGREWFELLKHKLLPQLSDDTYLVVAVVGGTHIGKSVVFNHLAGSRASATSPLASGTKHPVCLVPAGFSERHDLSAVFPGFELTQWADGLELEEHASHRLFWHTSDQLPENLLVLDTPDIDSDAQVNWTRADNIRHCADVLIAVHTQQKYNDAAVKQFFRKAATENKAVIVVFNQCQLPEDDEIWPIWLTTFADETGIQPEIVYVSPNDRQAAESNQLPFYERQWPPAAHDTNSTSQNLCDDLARLRFNDIKLRSLAGSLNHLLDPETGAAGYLREIAESSKRREAAVALLDEQELVQSKSWPNVPNNLLVPEIRNWWHTRRVGWPKHIHGFYDKVGTGITWPFRTVKHKLTGVPPAPEEAYRRQEWETILD
ncbi:MAG: GTPase domain-containing protein, partial [Planctomycetaceae bacterium]